MTGQSLPVWPILASNLWQASYYSFPVLGLQPCFTAPHRNLGFGFRSGLEEKAEQATGKSEEQASDSLDGAASVECTV